MPFGIGSYGYGLNNGYGGAYSAAVSAGAPVSAAPEAGKAIVNPGEDTTVHPGKRVSPAECQTCKERKYKDGSDECDVSFQTAQHIDPSAAGARVRAHEGEHVSNAYQKAAKNGGKVLQASVAIHTAVCPECGRVYVSGGTTTTKIQYKNEENPYVKNMKNKDRGLLSGMNLDVAG
ncbi:MAG: hypothetical protein IKQ44_10695 [Lachnospiraceae bacterium]|nr:hypothetical protein [Lachnospiraceae bacterium]